VRQLFTTLTGDDEPAGEPYAALNLPEPPPDRPYVFLNVVSTVDGKISLGTRSAGLGSRTDRRMMHLIRSNADAIIYGAGTLRAERVDPRVDRDLAAVRVAMGEPAQPIAVAVSASLALDPGHRFFVNGLGRTILFTTRAGLQRRERELEGLATFIVAGDDSVDLRLALRELRHRWNVRYLLCEGGPSLNQQLLDLDVLDEIFWTIAPKLSGGHGPTLFTSPELATEIRARLDLVSLFEQDSELFARYRVRRERPA
jgi:riboflavin-specific deaminase-like protein